MSLPLEGWIIVACAGAALVGVALAPALWVLRAPMRARIRRLTPAALTRLLVAASLPSVALFVVVRMRRGVTVSIHTPITLALALAALVILDAVALAVPLTAATVLGYWSWCRLRARLTGGRATGSGVP